jgi:nicotinate-nucleotide adenylyltransferase
MRIGLYGGSFDPVHNAHLALARCARDTLALDELLWIPAGQPWQKASGPGARRLAPARDRAAMVGAAIAGEPGFVLSTLEIDREGPSYTIDTVREVQQARPGAALYLVIGQDQYARLHTWHRWPELLATTVLAVAARGEEPLAPPPELAEVAHRVERLPMPRMDISSTAIRAHLAQGGRAADLVPALVPGPVARYIDQHRLYAGDH